MNCFFDIGSETEQHYRNLNLDVNLNVDLNMALDLNLECDKELKLKTETGAVLDDDHNGGPSTMTFGNDIKYCMQHKSAAMPAAPHARITRRRAHVRANKRSILGTRRSGC
jgi:hypothetical protein